MIVKEGPKGWFRSLWCCLFHSRHHEKEFQTNLCIGPEPYHGTCYKCGRTWEGWTEP